MSRSTGTLRDGSEVLVLVSDLHLRADGPTPRNASGSSEPFPQFVEALADEIRDTGAVIRLVVLGDMVDVTQVLMGKDPDDALTASMVRFGRIDVVVTMYRRACLDAILERAGHRSPVYVLGHTHVATRTALGGRDGPPWYFNTGSWTAPRDGRSEYQFVRVTRTASGDVRSELLTWPSGHL